MENSELLFAEERQEKILDILMEKNKISVLEMCKFFDVSSSTIRNDLRELENSGLLTRTHGGALLSSSQTGFEPKPSEKKIEMLKEKKAIAKIAADLVEDNDIIAIDTGTTTMEFAKAISHKKGIIVITNDLHIATYLEDHSNFEIMMLGGKIRSGYHYTFGNHGLNFLGEVNIDKAFITCNGLDLTKGITTPNIELASLKRKIIETASESILLCDSSKMKKVSFAKVGSASLVDYVVTDYKANESTLNAYESMEVTIINP